ncbi:hypothetical protein [Delftia tsuruhatensis]|uniref:Uncharacterized protein n=1 Tax=Delftia tsuruhatensis TaxID=180282 RepID=A0ABM6E4M1_9BURK|nr:hypothetical protein [Delftia tsuruhatensis]AOV01697.1 hypothetical protein BI380_10190 [Delftia tsuruhatensis]AOV02403.1 hypothetical protein BI380_14180 [Delftia tsuruhatensis]
MSEQGKRLAFHQVAPRKPLDSKEVSAGPARNFPPQAGLLAALESLIQEMRAQREAMQAQTEVIGQLAASNFALVQAMAQDGEMGDDLPPTVGLNGKPL